MPPQVDLNTLDLRVGRLEDDSRSIAESLRVLVRLEEHHEQTRAALLEGKKTMTEHDGRIRSLEVAQPLLELTSYWVRAGVLGILTLVGMAAWRMIFPELGG